MFLDAKTHHQTSSFLDPNTEQSLYLKVEDWFKDEPAFYWMIDEKPSSSSFVGLSIPRDQTLEFQFKVPAGFADRASIPIHIRTLLSDQRRLGITTIYYGAETVRKCLDILMKASSDRPNWSPNWSEPVLMYGAEFTWMKRSPESPAVYFKAIADENEICVLAVKEESPAYKAEFESDPVSPHPPWLGLTATTLY